MKHNWFILQYGREKETYFCLIYHPNPHSINRFVSHFEDAIVLAAQRLIKEGTTTYLSDFLLSELAIEEMNRFLYKKIQPEVSVFFVDKSASFEAAVTNKLHLEQPILLTFEQSYEDFNSLVHVQFFDGFYYDSIRNQLYDVEKIPIAFFENCMRETQAQMNEILVLGNENECVDLFAKVEAQFEQMGAKAVPICTVFINCTHQISARNFELIGEETVNVLLDLSNRNQATRKENFNLPEEDLPF